MGKEEEMMKEEGEDRAGETSGRKEKSIKNSGKEMFVSSNNHNNK